MRGSRVLSFLALGALAPAVSAGDNAHTDPTTLTPPPIPSGLPASIDVAMPGTVPAGASIAQSGAFLGFSVEMSVSLNVLGRNSKRISSQFVNLLRNIYQRAGTVNVRVGGNSADMAVLVPKITDGTANVMHKGDSTGSNTDTPEIDFTEELILMMKSISAATNARWMLNIPFNDTNFRLGIAESANRILGPLLYGLQAGNEPDFYGRKGHNLRKPEYSPYDYFGEFGDLINKMNDDTNVGKPNNLIGPSISLTQWSMEQMWATGFIDAYKDSLTALSIERYPLSGCGNNLDIGTAVDPQVAFASILTHDMAVNYSSAYVSSTALAVAAGKPFLNTEFNTATCSGIAGMSDSFGSALWMLDMALQMAHTNFSGAYMHVGGLDSFYNPFTAPAAADDNTQWTVRPVYYATLAMAEALGRSNTSQVLDLNTGVPTRPAYGIWSEGSAARTVLFNYNTDPSGANDYIAHVEVADGVSQVKVKYLKAKSVSDKEGVTWAGQTFGGSYGSDGTPVGDTDVQTASCSGGKCAVKVPAPGVALVFLSDAAFADSEPQTRPSDVSSNASLSAGATKPTGTNGRGAAGSGSDENGTRVLASSGVLAAFAVGLLAATVTI